MTRNGVWKYVIWNISILKFWFKIKLKFKIWYFFIFFKTCHIWPDMMQTSNIHWILTYLWSKQVLNLIILINLMIAARELTFGKMAFWHFTTGPIIYQVNGSKVVCRAMWICIFCLLPSMYFSYPKHFCSSYIHKMYL